MHNDIYNNDFENLSVGIIAQEQNRNADGSEGLEIKCNDFEICEYDIAVTQNETPEGSGMGIKYHQGSNIAEATAPANCTFSYTWMHETSDYHNECEDIIYWYPFNNGGCTVKPENHSVPEVNPQTNSDFTVEYNKDEFCPSNLGGGGGIEDEKGTMAFAGQQADSIQNLLSLLVDGGNTETLDNEVQTSIPEEALQLRDALLTDSPYLTDTVLVSSTNKENVLTTALVTEILSANPQSAKSDTVQQALNDRTEQLTEDQRTVIDQGWFVISAKESLEAKLSYYKANRSCAINNIIRHFRNDTISPSPVDSIIEILNNENQLWAKYALAFEYLSKDDSLSVVNTLDNIPSNFILTTQQTTQHQLHEDYFDLLLQLESENKTIFETDSIEKAELYTIYNDASGSLKAMLRNLLSVIDTLTYNEPYIFPGSLKSGKIRRIPIKKVYDENNFRLYPNPANNYIVIEYSMENENHKGFISFIDNNGKTVKSMVLQDNHDYLVIPIADLPNGIYICKFVINNKIIEVEKLIIIH